MLSKNTIQNIFINTPIGVFADHELKQLSVNLKKLGESDFEDLEVKVEKIFCSFCDEKFFIPANLDLHVQRNHQSETEDQHFQSDNIICLFCTKLVKGKNNFSRHLSRFHKDEGFKCKFKRCGYTFTTKIILNEHLKKKHRIEGKKIECKLCNRWYSCKFSFGTHVRKIHENKAAGTKKNLGRKFSCLFCADRFENKWSFYQHTKKNHEQEAIKCQIQQCIFFFKTKEKMKEHFKKKHENICKFCSLTFSNPTLLYTHLLNTHREKKCKFYPCNFYSDSKDELEIHVKEKHDKRAKTCECIYCGQGFVDKNHRIRHTKRVHAKIAIRCTEYKKCMDFFKTVSEMENHLKEAHKKAERHKKSVICLFCQKTIWDKPNYVIHIKTHHSEEAFRCKHPTCFSFFKNETDRKKHYEVKHVANFCCALCDYASSTKRPMKMHFEYHHLPKNKKCPQCPKSFRTNMQVNNHIEDQHAAKKCPHCKEVGTNLRRHIVTAECPTCSKPFLCKRLLAKHKIGCKNVFDCLKCGKTFKLECHLKDHVNDKHPFGQKWKGYQCKKCTDVFLSLKSLRGHYLEKHAASMKFKCDSCEERFFSAGTLQGHRFLSHGIGGAECRDCEKTFSTEKKLSEHLKWNHDKNNPRLQFVDCAECGKKMQKASFIKHFLTQHSYTIENVKTTNL